MKRVLILGIALMMLVLLAVPAFARPVSKLVCDPPTKYEDGSVMAPEEIDGYNVICQWEADIGPLSIVTFITSCSAFLADISTGIGDNKCTVRTVAWGVESADSNMIIFRNSGTGFFAPPPQGVAPGAGAVRLE